MHPFALSRTDDQAKRSRPRAGPSTRFHRGRHDLIGLIEERAQLPERLMDINGLPDMARIEALLTADCASARWPG